MSRKYLQFFVFIKLIFGLCEIAAADNYCACKVALGPDVIQQCPCPMGAVEVGRVKDEVGDITAAEHNSVKPLVKANDQAAQAKRLLLFGGYGQEIYLGCLNCEVADAESIYNPRGDYGNPFGEHSVYSRFGPYGSKFSALSVCNPEADYPPAVMDDDGSFYGYLTSNRVNPDAIRDKSVMLWLNERVCN